RNQQSCATDAVVLRPVTSSVGDSPEQRTTLVRDPAESPGIVVRRVGQSQNQLHETQDLVVVPRPLEPVTAVQGPATAPLPVPVEPQGPEVGPPEIGPPASAQGQVIELREPE